MILLESLNRIDFAIKNRSYAKFFHRDKIGNTCLLAFDESKRMLAVYASARVCPWVFNLSHQSLTKVARCNFIYSYLTKSSSLCGD